MLLLSDEQKEEACKPSNKAMICDERADKYHVPPLFRPKCWLFGWLVG
jgi:hypothetical protein